MTEVTEFIIELIKLIAAFTAAVLLLGVLGIVAYACYSFINVVVGRSHATVEFGTAGLRFGEFMTLDECEKMIILWQKQHRGSGHAHRVAIIDGDLIASPFAGWPH